MKLTGPQIITELREKLQFDMGRHLYGVLGTYQTIEIFAKNDLAKARDAEGSSFPIPLNVNIILFQSIRLFSLVYLRLFELHLAVLSHIQ